MKTCHSIQVSCSADKAFEFCLNVSRWPEVFPPCLDAKVLDESDTVQNIHLTARANDQVFSWKSTRHLDRNNRSIRFSQVKVSPLVNYMHGTWTVEQNDLGCEIALTHDFEVKDSVKGLVEGVNSSDDATAFMLKSVEDNSHRELAAIKRELERANMVHEFSETLVIPYSKNAIYQLLRDASQWPWLLPHCNSVDMHYQDPTYQEFTMCVQVGDIEEKIRSIRFLKGDSLEYFQPAPPPALTEHQGRWTLTETDGGIEVESWHSITLNPEFWKDTTIDAAKQKVETAINKNSMGTMQAIAGKLGVKLDEAA